MTTNFGVVGSPIQHSLSPVIHNAAYAALGLDFSYGRFEVAKGDLQKFLNESNLSGVSVTMPLKNEAFEISTEHEDFATSTGVVNTLVRGSDGWIGHNTDVSGFIQCFSAVPQADTVTILGSGATARSAALAVSKVFPSAGVRVIGRNKTSVAELIELLAHLGLRAAEASSSPASIVSSDLVISTVPGSSYGDLWNKQGNDAGTSRGFLFDVAYDPWPSTASKSWGPRSISGLELLVWQAIEQVKIFADSRGASVFLEDQELYEIMKTALHKESELN